MATDSKKKYRLLRENIVETLQDVEMDKVLSGRTPHAQWAKAELDKWLCQTLSQSFTAMGAINAVKRQPAK